MSTKTPSAPTPDILPRPDFHFSGQVGRTFLDSDPAQFPQPVQPPKGAPNIVLILLDDVGFGQFSTFGGGVPSPFRTGCHSRPFQPLKLMGARSQTNWSSSSVVVRQGTATTASATVSSSPTTSISNSKGFEKSCSTGERLPGGTVSAAYL